MPAATLQISYQEPATRLLIRLEAGQDFDNSIPFHVFPANPDRVAVTVGSYTSVGNRTLNVRGEIVKFEQSETAALRFPGVTSAAITTLEGAIFRASDLSEISPTWAYNGVSGEVIAIDPLTDAPVSVVGGAAVDYTAAYSRYIYTPETTVTAELYREEFGSIIAIKNRTVETLRIDAGMSENRQYAELYHVYSNVVIANSTTSIRDVWELPPNYPQSGEFPISSTGPDPNNSVAVERVHEIGYVNRIGFQKYERFYFGNEKPYTGSPAYKPDFTLRWQSAPEGFEDAFAAVDQAAVRSALSGRYPGLS